MLSRKKTKNHRMINDLPQLYKGKCIIGYILCCIHNGPDIWIEFSN